VEAGEKDRKQLELAKESERSLRTSSKLEMAEIEDQNLCDTFWPVCNEYVFIVFVVIVYTVAQL